MATIGIDFGNKQTCVAIYRNGGINDVEVVLNDHGNRATPSYVTFTAEGRLIGEEALNRLTANSDNVVYDIKRLLGKKYELIKDSVDLWPFPVSDLDGETVVKLKCADVERVLSPEELAGMFLQYLRKHIESYLGLQVEGAVMTVPTHATESMRRALIRAAGVAGLKVIRLMSSTTAAVVYHCISQKLVKERIFLVYDQGGHALDVSVIHCDSKSNLTVRSTAALMIGGYDFDLKIAQLMAVGFKLRTGMNLAEDKTAFRKLLVEAERVKRTLTYLTETSAFIESVHNNTDLQLVVTRAQFESAANDLFMKSLETVQKAIIEARLSFDQSIDLVLLIGGSSRIPRVRHKLGDVFFGRVDNSMNPEEAGAYGAAAIAAGVLNTFKEITAHAFSVAAKGGVAAVMIPRLSVLPVTRSRAFHTAGGDTVLISVLEGNRPRVSENEVIGKYEVKDVVSNKVNLQFELDEDCLLTVTATETRKGKPLKIVRTDNPFSVERIRNTERYNYEDEELEARAASRNQLQINAEDLKISINYEAKHGRLSAGDAKKMLISVAKTLRWLKSQEGQSAANDELLSCHCELLQASAPLFRAKAVLAPKTVRPGPKIAPLFFGDPVQAQTALDHLMTLGKILADDDPPVAGPSTGAVFMQHFDNGSGSSASSASLEDNISIVRDVLGDVLPHDKIKLEGEFVDSEALLQQVMQQFQKQSEDSSVDGEPSFSKYLSMSLRP